MMQLSLIQFLLSVIHANQGIKEQPIFKFVEDNTTLSILEQSKSIIV